MTFKAPKAQAAVVATATLMALTLGTIQQAHAGIITNSSTGLSNPTRTITFDELTFPQYTVITDQYSKLGVTFSPNAYFSSETIDGFFPNIDANNIGNYTYFDIINPLSIHFTRAQSAAAFALVTNEGVSTFTAFYKGAPVETFSTDVYPSYLSKNNYFGFSGIQFDQIQINAGGDGFLLLDNLQLSDAQVAPVPELNTMVLMLIAMVALLGAAWMNKKKEDATDAPLRMPAGMA